MAVEGGHPSIEIDYESLSAAERDPFSRFIDDLAGELHDQGKQLAVAVHAKAGDRAGGAEPRRRTGPDRRGGGPGDRADLRLRPGPSEPDRTALVDEGCPPTCGLPHRPDQGGPGRAPLRVRLGIGRAGVGRTYQELLELARQHGVQPRREWRDRHVVFDYGRGRGRHQVWLSDGATVAALLALGREVGIGGYAFWRLGGEIPPSGRRSRPNARRYRTCDHREGGPP